MVLLCVFSLLLIPIVKLTSTTNNVFFKAHSSVANHLLCDIDGVKSFDPEDDDTRLPLVIVDTTGCDMEELVEVNS